MLQKPAPSPSSPSGIDRLPPQILAIIARKFLEDSNDKFFDCQNLALTSKSLFYQPMKQSRDIKTILLENKRNLLLRQFDTFRDSLETASTILNRRYEYQHDPSSDCLYPMLILIGYGVGITFGLTPIMMTFGTREPPTTPERGQVFIDILLSIISAFCLAVGVGASYKLLHRIHRYEKPPHITTAELPSTIVRNYVNRFPSCQAAQEAILRLTTMRLNLRNAPPPGPELQQAVQNFEIRLNELMPRHHNAGAEPTERTPLLAGTQPSFASIV
jgi:hypothetical protein